MQILQQFKWKVDAKSGDIAYYNPDVISSVGYRVKSQRGVQFRIWATKVLKEYMIKGFALDDDRLKGHGGGNYWKELLDRIRDIRSSEKVLYRQLLDLYATSMDHDPKSAAVHHVGLQMPCSRASSLRFASRPPA